MKVYISGPMSGIKDENFPAFNAAARALRSVGYEVVNPAEFKTNVKGLEGKARWNKFLKADIKALMDCDGIVMLPGWQKSEGALLEIYNARALDFTVLEFESAILQARSYTDPAPEPAHA